MKAPCTSTGECNSSAQMHSMASEDAGPHSLASCSAPAPAGPRLHPPFAPINTARARLPE